nr:DEAD-box ATP-dependent RNA helicase 7-like [Tanacetum cinerariifolium]
AILRVIGTNSTTFDRYKLDPFFGLDAAEAILRVSDGVIPVFKSAAEDLLNSSGLSPVELLAKALAKSIGYTQIKQNY